MDKLKIRFALDSSDWHGHSSENLWAQRLPNQKNLYEILNTPFFARGIGYRDIVCADADADGTLEFKSVSGRAGHSTYIILVPVEQINFEREWKPLEELGCSYEEGVIEVSMGKMRMYAVDIPPGVDIEKIYHLLEKGEQKGFWMFQESHFFAGH